MGRRDAKLIRKIDPLHIIMPLIYPGRCDNEAYISERIDLTETEKFLEEKNRNNEEFKYTLFHIIVTAMMKTLMLRPKMNWFIANKRLYERNDITTSFVVKKQFSDGGAEALALLKAEPEDTVDTVHEKIKEQVFSCRSETLDSSSDAMNTLSKIPFFFLRFIAWCTRRLDVHGKVPKSVVATDPYYSSVVLSNIGSIKLKSGYHHLTNWGTNSIIALIGERKKKPFFSDDGTFEMKDCVDIGITIDERIADGYYYSKTIRLLKKLIENPTLLEERIDKPVDY